MVDFRVNKKVDTSLSENAYIPTGALVTKASPTSILENYDTDEKCLAAGLVPCDGRYLSPYTFKKIHSVISNIYGGNEYSDSFSEIQRTVSSFSVVTYGDFSLNRYIKLFLDNSDDAITIRDELLIPGYYEAGAQIIEVSSTYVVFWDSSLVFFDPVLPLTVSRVFGFRVPDLRTSRRYIYGQDVKGMIFDLPNFGIYTPSFSNNSSNLVTHSHSVNAVSTETLLTNNTSGTHTHTVGYTMANANAGHSHYWAANLPGLTATNAVGANLTKSDGTGTAAGAGHGHSTGAFYTATNSGESNILHGHSGSSTSSGYTEPTHTHSFISSNASTPSSSGIDIPYINVLYFIKI
jgi:hypothetical protein